MSDPVDVRCHCGAISVTLAAAPAEVTRCNCSLCRGYGVIWAYYDAADVAIPEGIATDTYPWNGRHVDFHRCRSCGCVTHWLPRDAGRARRGVNANLMPPDRIAPARVRHLDGADTGKYLD